MEETLGLLFLLLLLSVRPVHAQALLPPHAALPSGQECAKRVVRMPENRPYNDPFNHTIPPSSELAAFYNHPLQFNGPPNTSFWRVDGNFTGSTDEIIQWAACKWGMDVNQLRAQAWAESGWNQQTAGDDEFEESLCKDSNGGWNGWVPSGGFCYTSWSIIQIKCSNYSACPMAQESTPFALDFRGSYWRACMNGEVEYYKGANTVPGYPRYDDPNMTPEQKSVGCMGSWYAGDWYVQEAMPYIQHVQEFEKTQPWKPTLQIVEPHNDQVVSGSVTIKIKGPKIEGQCWYGCASAVGGYNECNGQGPYTWDSTHLVPNGQQLITVMANTCGLPGGDSRIGFNTAQVRVWVENPATGVVAAEHGGKNSRAHAVPTNEKK